MNPVEWSDPAVADLHAIDYLSPHSESAAERIADKIERAAAFLATMPGARPIPRRLDARKWRVATTPYLLIYLIYRVHRDRIEGLRVHHGSEDWLPE